MEKLNDLLAEYGLVLLLDEEFEGLEEHIALKARENWAQRKEKPILYLFNDMMDTIFGLKGYLVIREQDVFIEKIKTSLDISHYPSFFLEEMFLFSITDHIKIEVSLGYQNMEVLCEIVERKLDEKGDVLGVNAAKHQLTKVFDEETALMDLKLRIEEETMYLRSDLTRAKALEPFASALSSVMWEMFELKIQEQKKDDVVESNRAGVN